MLEPDFESSVKLLGPTLAISKNVENNLGFEIGPMGPVTLNLGVAFARLSWPTHPSMTS